MGRAIFLQALGDYLRPRRLLAWIFFGGLGILLAFSWSSLSPGSSAEDAYLVASTIVVFRVMLALYALVLATAIVSTEVEQKTIVYLLTRPVPRWLLLLMRYLAAVLVVSAVCGISLILISAAAYRGNPFGNPLLGKDLLGVAFGAVSYGGLFLFVTLLVNRPLILCLVYVFGWELVVPEMPGTMYYLSIFSHMQAFVEHPSRLLGNAMIRFLTGNLGTNTLSARVSTPVLVLIPVVTVAVSVWWFTQFEFVPREDAE